MNLLDAHNHLHDERLLPQRPEIVATLTRIGLTRAVVNGTSEDDWNDVTALAREWPLVQPSFGLHPWHATLRTVHWLERLRELLMANPGAGVGEIGLDRWVEGHDEATQAEVFTAQLGLAAELNRPATIHCIRAWGALAETLRRRPLPRCGFLIHAYGGSLEMMRELAKLGAYFSFNAYFLHDRKAAQRAVFKEVPEDRLLVETDAPSMLPPAIRNTHPLRDGSGEPINHPANIELAYTTLAAIRGVPVEQLAWQLERNFCALFGA